MQNSQNHAIVTGAGTGIGRAIAQRLSADGFAVTLSGRTESKLAETAATLSGRHLVAPLDIVDRSAVEATFKAAADQLGAPFLVVANAGMGGPNGGPQGEDRFDELVDINLRGTYHCLRAAEPLLAKDGDEPPRLVAISSILARIGVPGYTGYCASKAAVLGLVRAMAAELAPDVLVNAICPGWVETDMAWEGLDGMAEGMGITREEAHAMAMSDVPLGRMGKPDEVAGLVAYLASSSAAGLTGQGLDINGGAWMG
ncbi:MAG: SDR family NAD(P)-dependent oxidoreductase [Planctomycetota bacterium]|nr:SDR family NAD(P)-dependent oxidoreductase [Planctomycetota bacterium]